MEHAQRVAANIAESRLRWGKQGDTGETRDTLLDVITVLAEAKGVSRDEYNKVVRQLTACKAREAKRSEKEGD